MERIRFSGLLGSVVAAAAAAALSVASPSFDPERLPSAPSGGRPARKRGGTSYAKKGPGRSHRHGKTGRPHGLSRNLFPAGSLQMRAAQESAAKRARLYVHSPSLRGFY